MVTAVVAVVVGKETVLQLSEIDSLVRMPEGAINFSMFVFYFIPNRNNES